MIDHLQAALDVDIVRVVLATVLSTLYQQALGRGYFLMIDHES